MDEELKKEIEELIKSSLFRDSIEIGSASKTGNIKVYVDFNNKEEAEKKIKTAITVLKEQRNELI